MVGWLHLQILPSLMKRRSLVRSFCFEWFQSGRDFSFCLFICLSGRRGTPVPRQTGEQRSGTASTDHVSPTRYLRATCLLVSSWSFIRNFKELNENPEKERVRWVGPTVVELRPPGPRYCLPVPLYSTPPFSLSTYIHPAPLPFCFHVTITVFV